MFDGSLAQEQRRQQLQSATETQPEEQQSGAEPIHANTLESRNVPRGTLEHASDSDDQTKPFRRAKSPHPRPDTIPEPINQWDRWPAESDGAFEAFQLYRDARLGERSMRIVGSKLGKSMTLMERWSSLHKWGMRTAAFDRDREMQRRDAHNAEVSKMAQRHSALAMKLFMKVAKRLDTLDVEELSPRDVISMARLAVEMEYKSRGGDLMIKSVIDPIEPTMQ